MLNINQEVKIVSKFREFDLSDRGDPKFREFPRPRQFNCFAADPGQGLRKSSVV